MTAHKSAAQSAVCSCQRRRRRIHSWRGLTSCLRWNSNGIFTSCPPSGIHQLWETISRSHSPVRTVKTRHVSNANGPNLSARKFCMILGQLVYRYGNMASCGPLEIRREKKNKKTITQLYDAKRVGIVILDYRLSERERERFYYNPGYK